ncbi:MAG TPA: tyrosine-type recombinase/integrase, partial [Acetobacteraceae bacterium]|nr:tyrosine-type recombinase/integrase [Acetobacteraceae bacterium]
DHLESFVQLMAKTCLKSRAEKTERQITRAWARAQSLIPEWPRQELPIPERGKADESLPWSEYPASLKADAMAFVCPGQGRRRFSRKPARRERTVENYMTALRRAAHELVQLGVPPHEIRSLADLVQPERVEMILNQVYRRLGRERGGQLGLLAIVLLLAAREHVGLPKEQLEILAGFEKEARARREMGDRTFLKLQALSEDQITAVTQLPWRLRALARKHGRIDVTSARLMRAGLMLQLQLDTGARPGNIVGLNLETEVQIGAKDQITICIPGARVKNGREILCDLPPDTARFFRQYVEQYRAVHAGSVSSPWLFPRPDGSHWTTDRANATLQDLSANHIGVPINPHLVRSIIGLIIEDEHPGAIGLIRDALGHDQSATTETHYMRRNPIRARRKLQAAVTARRAGGFDRDRT